MSNEIRTRFAPSPTGHLHVGGARTALYSWLYARSTGGKFVLRIEDTDLERSTEEALEKQLEDLRWLGLNWDEGIGAEGDVGPYRQSLRKEIYQKHADQLIEKGQAFYCFCTEEEIQTQREASIKAGQSPHYSGRCRSVSKEEAKAFMDEGRKPVVRFLNKGTKEYVLNDLIRGDVHFKSDMVGDFVIIRSNGMPVYNFCCTIDDALMKISHVLRAEEHLNNTVRQLMIYEAFGWEPPVFGHLSIIQGEDRQKLSKRHGATSCNEYRQQGFLPEAMNNFLALLGWSSPKGDEILSMKELIAQFGLDRFIGSAAVFDEKKLRWVNATHLRALDLDSLWEKVEPFLKSAGIEVADDKAWRNRALESFKERMEVLSDAVELFRPLSDGSFEIDEKGKEALSWEKSQQVIEAWTSRVQAVQGEYLSEDDFSRIQDEIKASCDVKGKFLFMPVRVAVIGRPQGVDLQHLITLLPRTSLLKRAQICLGAIG